MSASSRVAYGPAHAIVRSSTRMPCSGSLNTTRAPSRSRRPARCRSSARRSARSRPSRTERAPRSAALGRVEDHPLVARSRQNSSAVSSRSVATPLRRQRPSPASAAGGRYGRRSAVLATIPMRRRSASATQKFDSRRQVVPLDVSQVLLVAAVVHVRVLRPRVHDTLAVQRPHPVMVLRLIRPDGHAPALSPITLPSVTHDSPK